MCPKKWAIPAAGHVQMMASQLSGGHKTYPDAGDRHDAIFYHITYYNAVHPTQNGIKHGKKREYYPVNMRHILRGNIKRDIAFYHIPWYKNLNEFTKANKTISHKTKATQQSKGN